MERDPRLSPEKQALLEQRLKGAFKKQGDQRFISKQPHHESMPLSFAQRQMWVIDQITPGNPAYNLPVGYRIIGKLDSHALEEAFNAVIQRHEVLRTTFGVKNGEPIQSIVEECRIQFAVTKLGHLAGLELESAVQKLASEEAVKPFDLSRLPLIRVFLFELSEAEHVLIINLHHIAADGMSIGLLLDELDVRYEALVSGSRRRLPDLPIQYADFALWQRQEVDKGAYVASAEFWRNQLKGKLPVLDLPRDQARPPFQSFKGGNVFFALPKVLTQKLMSLGAREGCTFFVTILTVFQVILHRYSGVEDILIGTPVTNRPLNELQPLIGNFLNIAVLRCRLTGNPTFLDMLRISRETTLDALTHQALPFEEVIKHLKFDRDPSRNPVFQVMLQVLPSTRARIGDLEIRSFDFDLGFAQFDLTLHLYEKEEGYLGRLEYCTDLFHADRIKRLSLNFLHIIEGIVSDPGLRLSDIPIDR